MATVEWIVQYKISDPYKYLFKLRDVEQTFRLMTEASMRTVVGDHSVTELLTVGREAIAAKAKELLSDLCKLYDNGISVQQLVLQDVDPPESGASRRSTTSTRPSRNASAPSTRPGPSTTRRSRARAASPSRRSRRPRATPSIA